MNEKDPLGLLGPDIRAMADSSMRLQESIERGRRETFGHADVIFDRLMKQISDFQATLKPEEEVGAYLASFGREMLIHIENIGYRNPYLIVFRGVLDTNKDRVELVQHATQVNVLLRAVPKIGETARRIGFGTSPTE